MKIYLEIVQVWYFFFFIEASLDTSLASSCVSQPLSNLLICPNSCYWFCRYRWC